MLLTCRHKTSDVRHRWGVVPVLLVGLALLAMQTGHVRSAHGQTYPANPDQVPAWPNADGRLPPVTTQFPPATTDALPSPPESYSVYPPSPAQQVWRSDDLDKILGPRGPLPPPATEPSLPSVASESLAAWQTNPPDAPRATGISGTTIDGATLWSVDFLARGYFLDDQRIQWSGQEATFGAEGVFTPVVKHCFGGWVAAAEGEFYLNQPFDRNRLADTAERRSYLANYEVQTFEISKLQVSAQNGPWTVVVGKMETPFGRTYFPLYTNSRMDAPFIRTESILWRETGAMLRCRPGLWVADVAITNGSEDRDTNSSKAVVSRAGVETENWALGFSAKWQDGIGSEGQKQYKNHIGADAMVRWDRFTLSAEAIYDEYGFRRPGFDPNDITWQHSIYYRDLNYRLNDPIWGVGYYVNLGYQGERWDVQINYGEFYPKQIGVALHDVTHRRGITKAAFQFTPHLLGYAVVLGEENGMIAQDGRRRNGLAVLGGLQYTF